MWYLDMRECTCHKKVCTCGVWTVMDSGGVKRVGLNDAELAIGIVDRINAAGLKRVEK